MKSAINEIINSILKDNEKEQEDIIRSVLEKMQESLIDMSDPDHFYTMFIFPLQNASSVLAKNLHENPIDKKNSFKLDFLFTNYGFLSSHIEKLISSRCGSCCVCDCSRNILNIYKTFLLTNIIPEDDFSEEHYWIPKFGTYKEWISYCDSLYELYYGNPLKYLTSYSALVSSDIRKYQHTIHKWFLKWKDGNEYHFYDTYDSDEKNPLDEYYADNEFYLINKRYLPNASYETAKEKRMPFMLKVPKKDVLSIKCISETIYIQG